VRPLSPPSLLSRSQRCPDSCSLDSPAAAKFDLNEFLAGASFPAEATTAVPGIVAAAPSAA